MPPEKPASKKKPASAKPAASKPATKKAGGKKLGMKAALSPEQVRAVVRQCIKNAAGGQPFGPNTKLKNIPAAPDAVRKCVNISIPLKGPTALTPADVTGEDTETTIAAKVLIKLKAVGPKAKNPVAKGKQAGAMAFDPQPVVHQCILNAAGGQPFNANTRFANIPAPAAKGTA